MSFGGTCPSSSRFPHLAAPVGARPDLERPVTRFFCPTCGTGLGTRSPARPDSMIIKVGTLDDPSGFKPQAAILRTDPS
mgnify:CR=1 FL=1